MVKKLSIIAALLFCLNVEAQQVVRNENAKVRIGTEGASNYAPSVNRYQDVYTIPRQVNITLPVLGSLAFGSISGSYATCMLANAYSGRIRGIVLKNDTDKTLIYSLNGGTADHYPLGSGDGLFIPFSQLNVFVANGAITIKHAGSAPTSGSAYCTVIPEN